MNYDAWKLMCPDEEYTPAPRVRFSFSQYDDENDEVFCPDDESEE